FFFWSWAVPAAPGGQPPTPPCGGVTWRVRGRGCCAGPLLAFTLSVDEFIIAFFTAGAGRASTTLPMQIYAMIRFGITPEINALATIVMAVSITALTLSQRLNRGIIGQ
ncbi:ABC transporter permease, partial [Mesorhizobium sp. M0587]